MVFDTHMTLQQQCVNFDTNHIESIEGCEAEQSENSNTTRLKIGELIERVDLSTHNPRIRRKRRTNHAENAKMKSELISKSNSAVEFRKKNPVSALDLRLEPQNQPQESDQTHQSEQSGGWCILI